MSQHQSWAQLFIHAILEAQGERQENLNASSPQPCCQEYIYIGFTTHGDTFYAVLGGCRLSTMLFSYLCQNAHESGSTTSGHMHRINCKVLFAPRTLHGVIVEGATTMQLIYEEISAHAKKLGQLIINMLPCGISRAPYQRYRSNPKRETRSSTSPPVSSYLHAP